MLGQDELVDKEHLVEAEHNQDRGDAGGKRKVFLRVYSSGAISLGLSTNWSI